MHIIYYGDIHSEKIVELLRNEYYQKYSNEAENDDERKSWIKINDGFQSSKNKWLDNHEFRKINHEIRNEPVNGKKINLEIIDDVEN